MAVAAVVVMTPALAESTIALYDIDAQRLEDSRLMLKNLNRNCGNKARIEAYLGVSRPTVMKLLDTLKAQGLVVVVGKGRTTRYMATLTDTTESS